MMTSLELQAMVAMEPFARFFKSEGHSMEITPDHLIFASFNNQDTGETIADLSIEQLRKLYAAYTAIRSVIPADPGDAIPAVAHPTLRAANVARQIEWDPKNKVTLLWRSNELAGEGGEAIEEGLMMLLDLAVKIGRVNNTAKKIQRERDGLPGSRAPLAQLANELADVVICADLVAMTAGIDLMGQAVPDKFNETSEKVGLKTRLGK